MNNRNSLVNENSLQINLLNNNSLPINPDHACFSNKVPKVDQNIINNISSSISNDNELKKINTQAYYQTIGYD